MSLELGPSLLRAFIVTMLSLLLAVPAGRCLEGAGRRIRPWLWAAVGAAVLTPAILPAYAYLNVSLHLIRQRWALELLYGGLLLCRGLALGILVNHLLPGNLTDAGRHSFALTRPSLRRRVIFAIRHGLHPGTVVGAALVFLASFNEFEMASLFQLETWPVVLFDQQTQGYVVGETLKQWRVPLMIQLAAMGIAVFSFSWFARVTAGGVEQVRNSGSFPCGPVLAVAVPAMVWFVVPVAVVGTNAFRGVGNLTATFPLQREIGDSLAVGIAAGSITWWLARVSVRSLGRWTFVLLVPGLLGPLTVALTLMAVAQWRLVAPFYDTPIPLLLGLVLIVLPAVTLLHWLVYRHEGSPEVHVARQTGERRILSRAGGSGAIWVWTYAFAACFFELPVSAILSPPDMTPVMVRLYNLMHYGRDIMLSAYFLVTLLVPLGVAMLALGIRRVVR